MSWQTEYDRKKFFINTTNPSVVVRRLAPQLKPGSYAADIGCGAGRNAIHLAKNGYKVFCSDLVDLHWVDNINNKLVKKNIQFTKQSAQDFKPLQNEFDAIILARLIQYIDKNGLERLISRIALGLKPNGYLAISYTAKGGIIDEDEYDFKKHEHSLTRVKDILEKVKLHLISCNSGSKQSRYVPHRNKIESYDIIAQKMTYFPP